jgi:hypothetical protein
MLYVFLFLILLTEFPNIRGATEEEEEAEGDDPLYIFPPALAMAIDTVCSVHFWKSTFVFHPLRREV